MSDAPWPPELVLLESCGGDWERYCDRVYGEFHRDFVASRPTFHGRWVGVSRNRVVKRKEVAFWHCISAGEVEADRLPDLRRCERIRWPRKMLEAVGTGRVKWWRRRRGAKRRAYVALADFSYLVVLEEMSSHCVLVTAYPIDEEHERRKLRTEFDGAPDKG